MIVMDAKDQPPLFNTGAMKLAHIEWVDLSSSPLPRGSAFSNQLTVIQSSEPQISLTAERDLERDAARETKERK